MVEYGFLLTGIAIVVGVAAAALGPEIAAILESVAL